MDNDNFFNYDEMMEEKKARRQALMSDREIELTEQYLLWYRRGYEDKQRLGLIEKWRDIEKYWEGEFEYDDENDLYLCRSEADAPDIDAVVCVASETPIEPGTMLRVRVTDSDVYDLYAEVVEE